MTHSLGKSLPGLSEPVKSSVLVWQPIKTDDSAVLLSVMIGLYRSEIVRKISGRPILVFLCPWRMIPSKYYKDFHWITQINHTRKFITDVYLNGCGCWKVQHYESSEFTLQNRLNWTGILRLLVWVQSVCWFNTDVFAFSVTSFCTEMFLVSCSQVKLKFVIFFNAV